MFDPHDYWQERLHNNFNLRGVGHHSLGHRFNTWMYRVRRRVFIHRVSQLPINPHQANILDVGSGTGFYIRIWQELGVQHLTGLDITTVAVENLKLIYPGYDFIQADISEAPSILTGKYFDIVSAIDVLFHIVEDARYTNALTNIYQLLRPGGYLIFSENFIRRENITGRHQVSRRLEWIQDQLVSTGFVALNRIPLFYWMNAPVDSENPFHKAFWRVLSRLAGQSELAGFVLGGLLYPVELLSLAITNEGPSTELMVCHKPQ